MNIEYKYDDNGNLIEKIEYFDGICSYTYKYNPKENNISSDEFNSDDKLENENNLTPYLTVLKWFYPDGKLNGISKFDSTGFCFETTQFNRKY